MPEPTTAQRYDELLREAVMEELAWHALIDASQLDVTVDGGLVTVVGTVPSMAEKLVALDTVEMVDGVHDVITRIDVKVPPAAERNDPELDAVIEQVLTWDALVPEQDVSHHVSDGWVTLKGSVPTERQRGEAERAVGHIVGVRGVSNELAVEEPSLVPDDVREEITRALERRAVHRARQIDVVVDEHRITLSGSVQSAREKRAILGAVSHAPGVTAVCDELIVRPDV